MQASIEQTKNLPESCFAQPSPNDCGALLQKNNPKTVSRKQRLLSSGNLALICDAFCSYQVTWGMLPLKSVQHL